MPNAISSEFPKQTDRFRRRRTLIRSFEARALRGRTTTQRLADAIIKESGTLNFVFIHLLFFCEWIIINLGIFPVLPIFDPFPFGLLTMIVSLEAIFLAIFVLVSQNRQSYVATLRDELHMQINLIAEEEITKTLGLVSEIHDHLKIKKGEDKELKAMLKHIDTSYIEHVLERELGKYEHQPILSALGNKSREGLKKLTELAKNGTTGG